MSVPLKDLLRDGARPALYGTCAISTSPHFLAVAQSCALDFIFIDTERVALDREKLEWMCRSFSATGIAPIVRVPESYPAHISGMLNSGACGIVSPYVETAQQVLSLVGATKLQPLKGAMLQDCIDVLAKEGQAALESEVQGVVNAVGYVDPLALIGSIVPSDTLEVIRKKTENTLLFVNIESNIAVENLPHLLNIPGVDGCFISPHELSLQIGCPNDWENPAFLETCDYIVTETAQRGLAVGCHYSFSHSVEYQKRWRSLGANLIVHQSDLQLYQRALSADLKLLRSSDGTQGESGMERDPAFQDDDDSPVPSAQVLEV